MDNYQGQEAIRTNQDVKNEMWMRGIIRYVVRHRGIRVSFAIAFLLLALDIVVDGASLHSMLFCPVWFFASIIKNAVQRPGWKLAALRISIPLLTLLVSVENSFFQIHVATENASRIVAACENFHAATGKFPQVLNELVPDYLPTIPRAKYCLSFNKFSYWNLDGHATLTWYEMPPFGRRIYDFDQRRWGSLD
jgi:hypothetical protein